VTTSSFNAPAVSSIRFWQRPSGLCIFSNRTNLAPSPR
jgi:hypothetical protein